MVKYHFKNYLNRAFWNSLFAVLSAFVLVLIIIFSWQEIRAVMSSLVAGDDQVEEKEMSRLELLESLKGNDEVSEEDKTRLLEELQTNDEDVTEEEKLQLLELLKTSS